MMTRTTRAKIETVDLERDEKSPSIIPARPPPTMVDGLPQGSTSPLTSQPSNMETPANFEELSLRSPRRSDEEGLPPRGSNNEDQTHHHVSNLGHGMRDMYHTVNKLRAAGVEDLNIPLPKIAVIGNQSAGKSSLIEAISGIKVPRYTGTCTRCPLEINLTESSRDDAHWTCDVSLRFNWSYDPTRRGRNPWTQKSQEQVSFLRLNSLDDVEEALIRAQSAILCPRRKWEDFRTGPSGGQSIFDVQFSPNVVCLDIRGPNMPNLAFIDLPGLFHVTERHEENYLINLVEKLVVDNIKSENCLVLLAVTMKDDAVNQSSVKLATKYAAGRTIGALTKPDTLTEGEHEQWINVLQGRTHKMAPHGYFVTKQPSQRELLAKISHKESRQREEEFFKSNEPWSVTLQHYTNRFGTANLQTYLSEQLGQLIKSRLPDLVVKVQADLNEVDRELEILPAPPAENCFLILAQLLSRFEREVSDMLDGNSGPSTFRHRFQTLTDKFRRELMNIRPRLNVDDKAPEDPDSPFAPPGGLRGSRAASSISSTTRRPYTGRNTNSTSDVPDSTGDYPNGRKRNVSGSHGNPHKKQRTDRVEETVEREIEDTEMLEEIPQAAKKKTIVMHLKDVRRIIQDVSLVTIPDSVDSKARDELTRLWTNLWEEPLDKFLVTTRDMLLEDLLAGFETTFAPYNQSGLFECTSQILHKVVHMVHKYNEEVIGRIFQLEANHQITLNKDDYAREQAQAQAALMNRRRGALEEQQRQKAGDPETPSRRKQGGENAGRPEVDPFKCEIETMVSVYAYSTIARRRFLDNVVISMIGLTFEHMKAVLKDSLEDGLGLKRPDAEAHCKQLMAENPEKEKRRQDLLERKELLTRAWAELERYT